MESSSKISVATLTKNNKETLKKTLEALRNFSEVILLDTGSEDKTLEIANTFPNVRIFHSSFLGFGTLRNLAAQYAHNDWIFALDSDEVPSQGLLDEIETTPLSSDTLYKFPFHNFYHNKWIRSCGWHPESHLRLYHRKKTQFSEDLVHEKLLVQNLKIHSFHNPILHTPYRTQEDFLRKMQIYSSLFAEQNYQKKKASLSTAIIHAFFAFLKSYFLKRGFCQGQEGFILSIYQANTAFYKYLKLAEKNRCS